MKQIFWVFRRYSLAGASPGIVDSTSYVVQEQFALHFIEPFQTRKEAQAAIDNAKIMQPWQEFIILRG